MLNGENFSFSSCFLFELFPNTLDENVPIGKSDKDNVIIKYSDNNNLEKSKQDDTLDHSDIGKKFNQYDNVFHEHIGFHSLKSVIDLSNLNGLFPDLILIPGIIEILV